MSPNPKVAFPFCSLAKPEYCVHHSTNDRSYTTPISSISINEPIKSVLLLPLDRKSFTNLSICLPIYFCPKFIVNLITHLFIYLFIYLINYWFVYSSFTFSGSQFKKISHTNLAYSALISGTLTSSSEISPLCSSGSNVLHHSANIPKWPDEIIM